MWMSLALHHRHHLQPPLATGAAHARDVAVRYTLSRRPVIVLGLVRDTLTQRLSYYDDFVKPHPKRHLYHPDVKAYPDMLSWCRAPSMVFSGAWKGDYPQEIQLRPFYDLIFGSGLNSAWKAVALDDAWEEASKTVSRTGGRIGFVGAQSNLLVSMCVFSRLTEFPIPWDESSGAHTPPQGVVSHRQLDPTAFVGGPIAFEGPSQGALASLLLTS